jgi:hypothetical protein
MIAVNLPRSKERLRSSRAVTRVSPSPKTLVAFSTLTASLTALLLGGGSGAGKATRFRKAHFHRCGAGDAAAPKRSRVAPT